MILKYEDMVMRDYFISSLYDTNINESNSNSDNIVKKILNDLKLNLSIVGTFGTGMGTMIPIVSKLVENGTLKFEPTKENIIMLTIAGLLTAYLEEHKTNNSEYKKAATSLLEELKLRGIGETIVKKVKNCILSIGNFFKIVYKNKVGVMNGFFDMFAYSSLLIPTMNALLALIDKYNFTIDNLPNNLLSIGLALATLIAKHGINYLISKFKKRKEISSNDIDDIESVNPIIKKFNMDDKLNEIPIEE